MLQFIAQIVGQIASDASVTISLGSAAAVIITTARVSNKVTNLVRDIKEMRRELSGMWTKGEQKLWASEMGRLNPKMHVPPVSDSLHGNGHTNIGE